MLCDRSTPRQEGKAARYAPCFATAQHLCNLLTEIQDLTLRMAERTEGWTEKSR